MADMLDRIPPRPTALHVGQLNLPNWDWFEAEFRNVFERDLFASRGPLQERLEAALADYLGVRHVICVVNATVALTLTARALDLRGDVLVPSFTFAATAQALNWAGLNPVFCDVESETHNLSPRLVERHMTKATSGVLAVHLWGRACDVAGLDAVAKKYGLALFFDSAHAVGCTYNGTRIGGFGEAEIFSFHATKVLNGAEGGCIATNNDETAAKLRTMLSVRADQAVGSPLLRINGRMSEAQAAMALLSFEHLPANIEANRKRYELYRARLDDIEGLEFIDHAGNEASNFQYVVIRVADSSPIARNDILKALESKNIFARDYFSPPIHRMPFYRDAPHLTLPVTDLLASSLIQLPTGQAVSEHDVEAVCEILSVLMRGHKRT